MYFSVEMMILPDRKFYQSDIALSVLVINCNVRCSSTASQDVEDDSRILTISININGVDEAPVQGRESAFYNVNIIWTKVLLISKDQQLYPD